MNEMLETLGRSAKAAEIVLRNLDTAKKNQVLEAVADSLVADSKALLTANAIDVENGRKNQMPEGLVDRLMLTEARIASMAEGLRQVASLEDPVGEVTGMKKRPNGLLIGQKRVPLGVIGIIYEARPNVTADAFALCFKTGNVVILKGGSDAIHSNTAIVDCIRRTLDENGITKDAIQLISDTSRETAGEFMKMNEYVDVLIPRGGKGLIKAVVNNSTIPVIETGTGNCHIYVDESADLQMAADIVMNAKTQRVGVCNACESLLVHEKVKERYLLEKRMTEEEGEEVPADEEEEFEVQYARLRKVVDGLPEKCREIFILGCVDGLSYKEVSEKMGVSVNTVKTQIKLAYRKLKLELGGQNFVWEWTAGGVLFILMQK